MFHAAVCEIQVIPIDCEKAVSNDNLAFGIPEYVFVELDYHDRPRSGIATVLGIPHRFECLFDEERDDWSDEYVIVPIDAEILVLEIEQFQIFLDWRDRFDRGLATTEDHPVYGDENSRFIELNRLLGPCREIDIESGRRAFAEFQMPADLKRYRESGVTYTVRWRLID
jgi:hypothetical protein